jgi:class 3 adenylate cyclase
MSESLFAREEAVIEKAQELLEHGHGDVPLYAYDDLLRHYQKLLRQTRRLIRMNDRQQQELNVLNEKTQSAYREINQINQVARLVNSTLDRHEVIQAIANTLFSLFSFNQVGLLLRTPENALAPEEHFGLGVLTSFANQIYPLRFPEDPSSKFHELMNAPKPEMVPEISEILGAFPLLEQQYFRYNRVQSCLFIPLTVQNNPIGLLLLAHTERNIALPEEDIAYVERFAVQVATAINNANLYYHLREARLQLAESERIIALTQTFEKFVPREFLNRIAKDGFEHIRLGNTHTDVITMLFSDIRAFTSLSETMTPRQLMTFLNNYLQLMNEPIRANQGFVDKFVGDAIMALYDHPEGTDEGEAIGALRSAIGMQRNLTLYNRMRLHAGYSPIAAGIGIHSGEVIIGTIGSENRMDSTVLGDAVNLASRLESLTKYYGVKVIASDATHALVADLAEFQWRQLDRVMVQGKSKVLTLYELLNADQEAVRERKLKTLPLFDEARELYREGRWQDCLQLFEECLRQFPDDPVPRVYIERTKELLLHPPKEEWDGAIRMTFK